MNDELIAVPPRADCRGEVSRNQFAKRSPVGAAILALISMLSSARADDFDSSKLSGQVTDATGHPIAGAEVWMNRFGGRLDPAQLAARRWKTITDKNGNYELTLRYPKGETLVVKEMFAEARGKVRGSWEDEISLQGGKNATGQPDLIAQ